MKKIVLLIVFLFLSKPILPVVEYVINYDYIVKNLCENKAKPEMKCNGKCHLMKQMAKASENESNNSQDKKSPSSEFEILFLENEFKFEFPKQNDFVYKVNVRYIDNYVYHDSTSFFHPPLV